MSQEVREVVLPHYLTPDHLLGFLEALYSLGGRADPMFLGDILGENVDVLPHVIDVAEALGLLTYSKNGELTLSELGERVVKGNVKNVKKILKENARKIEPLKTLLKILEKAKRISVEEFVDVLSRFYYLHLEEAKKNILLWGAFLGLFKMDVNDEYIEVIR
ncbi:AAA-associated domain-containing protein [Thermogladius sp. 4427co]|uniref:AAA-associated domain-containing protein n=1 Tax=Thermogladius sp. 4427co TaxID=3450718 RepID=UPI003F7AB219